ncbi:MAG: hypothetical protein JSV62_14710 [Promethearchaeota archaeon]|nr:MAG: hypothetical protein JSV62_14710 [Candidatus Lokiarchaeota archaeon]
MGVFISNFSSKYHTNEDSITLDIQPSSEIPYTIPWLRNTNFDDQSEWVSSKEGDESDVDAFISNGLGNYIIHGDSGLKRIDEPLNNGEWHEFNNPEFPISPDTNSTTSAGLEISHTWDEGVDQTRNTPSIHWKRNIRMPVNMSDYIITDAFLEVIFNASVTANGTIPNAPQIGGIERPGDYTDGDHDIEPRTFPEPPQFAIGDFATFYVLISDLGNVNTYQIAENITTDLGRDNNTRVTHYHDSALDPVPKNILLSYLNSVLEYDNRNFTITLGIDLYCEDNDYNVDIDIWDRLIIRSLNLTIVYTKNIDQYTIVSLEQAGAQITGENIRIDEGLLNFDYMINNTMLSNLSPNSEIRLFINDKYLEKIKLSRATDTLQSAFSGGIDVTSFITKDINIALKIQVYLRDEFGLPEDIIISIDNVFFQIRYTVLLADSFEEPFIFRIMLIVACIAGLCTGGYLVAYQRFLKYPKSVRKVRKYRKTLPRKNEPAVSITTRESSFKKAYEKELHISSSFLKGKPTPVTPISKPLKESDKSKNKSDTT